MRIDIYGHSGFIATCFQCANYSEAILMVATGRVC